MKDLFYPNESTPGLSTFTTQDSSEVIFLSLECTDVVSVIKCIEDIG